MYGVGFTETLLNPNPGRLAVTIRLGTRSIKVWEHSYNQGNQWMQGNAYIGWY